ncbi:1,2-phenylacetyl-CoA epoxidase subunit PaaE [Flavisolibacter tropicus]|uniref:Phenylacetic acid degradation protein n=1 Tax=Flavisolibacter tropicus TaxID=1492898 RepID=A0A172TZ92_9BACT|nr:1,2-phenylacetyl-CoA epoxidase subunit PaaE [Flavisolibacter tropicus]ANE52067.1 phenylacetic acid degradation protein [Flavisolibacter tropicus]
MIHFHSLPVKKVQQETEDCVSIVFDVPSELKDLFAFKQGQSLTIRKQLNGEELRRSYSICSSPIDGELRVAVKKVEGGLFSTYANESLKKGDLLEVMPPVGKFYTELNAEQHKNYVAFAAGSGITPILSIIKTTLQTEPNSTFTLVFGNRTKNSIIFKEELEAIKDKYINRFRIYHVLSRERTDAEINTGRLDATKCQLFLDKLIDVKKSHDFFLCGPEEMIFCVRDLLQANGVAKEHIHFELFTVPGQKKSTVNTEAKPVSNEGPQAKVSVKLDGILFDFDLPYGGQSILDAALKQGADLPYACKGGVCCTCKAKLVEGQVEMEVNWGLEQDEIDAGYILTCQSHPKTEKVVVDFDAK